MATLAVLFSFALIKILEKSLKNNRYTCAGIKKKYEEKKKENTNSEESEEGDTHLSISGIKTKQKQKKNKKKNKKKYINQYIQHIQMYVPLSY